MRRLNFFREGGYVNERNQLQENSRILFASQGCGGFFKGMGTRRLNIQIGKTLRN